MDLPEEAVQEARVDGCKNIMDYIDKMDFISMDDQQINSVIMMREIASRVADGESTLVTEGDVTQVLCMSIDYMVTACRKVVDYIGRMTFEDLEEEEKESVMKMLEIARGIISKQGAVVVSQFSDPDEELEEEVELRNVEGQVDGEIEVQGKEPVPSIQSSVCHSIFWPLDGLITQQWVEDLMSTLEKFSWEHSPSEFQNVIPIFVVEKLIESASIVLDSEPNCVEMRCGEASEVIVVGDIHGHFHDLIMLFKDQNAGLPSENRYFVFNGNYVDKGAWGLEVLLTLLAWKVLMPHRVYILRGNHETKDCTSQYGFKMEVASKYGNEGEDVYNKCLELFKVLPLASIIAGEVYTTHGGLFRKGELIDVLALGSLEDLSNVDRRVVNAPNEDTNHGNSHDKDEVSNIALTDILWSDPSTEDGLKKNTTRGAGLWWGPDCTEAFLKRSNLKVIIRSHEGPDERNGHEKFNDMLDGHSLDHEGESGKLYTVFSAPNCLQVGTSFKNRGAYAVLKSPDFNVPAFHSFEATDRPKAHLCVDSVEEQCSALLALNSGISMPQQFDIAEASFGADFGALGISNPPSWNVSLADNEDGIHQVPVLQTTEVEGLPLPSDLAEPHKANYEYLFRLINGLKHEVRRMADQIKKKAAGGAASPVSPSNLGSKSMDSEEGEAYELRPRAKRAASQASSQPRQI